jgi:hypothetical protein
LIYPAGRERAQRPALPARHAFVASQQPSLERTRAHQNQEKQQMQLGRLGRSVAVALALALGAGAASALTVPFTEDFTSGVAGWRNGANTSDLSHVASGGPDGGAYASGTFNYFGFVPPFPGAGPVTFRGQDEFSFSGLSFVGDWIAGGVEELSVWVRQNTSETLTYFLRVASSFNFPGAVIVNTTPVLPNVWTQLTFAIDPSSPLCFGEGVSCAAALADVDHVQFGTSAPAALTGLDQAFTLDIDKISISTVPEPATALLFASALAGIGWIGTRRRTS